MHVLASNRQNTETRGMEKKRERERRKRNREAPCTLAEPPAATACLPCPPQRGITAIKPMSHKEQMAAAQAKKDKQGQRLAKAGPRRKKFEGERQPAKTTHARACS